MIPFCIRRAIHDGAEMDDILDIYDADGNLIARDDIMAYYCKHSGSISPLFNLLSNNKVAPIPNYVIDFADFTIAPYDKIMMFSNVVHNKIIKREYMQKILDAGFADLTILDIDVYAAMNLDLRKALNTASFIIVSAPSQPTDDINTIVGPSVNMWPTISINMFRDTFASDRIQAIIAADKENEAALMHNMNLSDIDYYALIRRVKISAEWRELISTRRPITHFLLNLDINYPLSRAQIDELLGKAILARHTLYDAQNKSSAAIEYRRCFINKSEEHYLALHNMSVCCVSDSHMIPNNICGLNKLFVIIADKIGHDDSNSIYSQMYRHIVEKYPQYYTHLMQRFALKTLLYRQIYQRNLRYKFMESNNEASHADIRLLLAFYKGAPEYVNGLTFKRLYIEYESTLYVIYDELSMRTLRIFAATYSTIDINICKYPDKRGDSYINNIFGIIKIDKPANKLEFVIRARGYDEIEVTPHIIFEIYEQIIIHSPRKLDQLWHIPIFGHNFIKWFESRLQRRAKIIGRILQPICDVDAREKIYEHAAMMIRD
jgi:hypothetical protein